MKNKSIILFAALGLALATITGCVMSQAQASAVFIASEAVTAGIIQKTPAIVPTLQLIVDDWAKFQGGKLSAVDEAALLNQVVIATGKQLTPMQAAVLDGAVQQIIANQNNTAPTPLSGAAGAAISDVVGGIARELVVYNASKAP